MSETSLNQKLIDLSDADYQTLLKDVAEQRINKVRDNRKAQKLQKYPKPENLTVKEFNSFIARTKELFLGRKDREQEKIILNVEITKHLAWTSDMHPSLISYDVVVTSKCLSPGQKEDIQNILTETFDPRGEKDNLNDTSAYIEMRNDINQLVEDIKAKEKVLGLSKNSIWDAVYARCEQYSQD